MHTDAYLLQERYIRDMNIRKAKSSDAKEISGLMSELGYSISAEALLVKLTEFAQRNYDQVFVAESNGNIRGCISCHITSLFHQPGSSGRITSLVVAEASRGKGIGQLLVETAEDFFRANGCIKSEVTSGEQRHAAHQFYLSCGFSLDERRFIKLYN